MCGAFLHQEADLDKANAQLCAQHAELGHQCSTMLSLTGQLVDASPAGNNCFVRTLVAAVSAFSPEIAIFSEHQFEAGRDRLYWLARAAQSGQMRHGCSPQDVNDVSIVNMCSPTVFYLKDISLGINRTNLLTADP